MDELELELKTDFLQEAKQLLDEAEQSFLELQSSSGNPEIINQIFRLAHNLKGTSRAVGFGEIAEFTHKMENLILKLKNNEIPATEKVISVLLACNDQVRVMVTGLEANLSATFECSHIVAQIDDVMSGNYESSNTEAAIEIPASDISLVEEGINPEDVALLQNHEVPDLMPAVHVAPPPVVLAAVETPKAPAKESAAAVAAKVDESIRVSLQRLDKLNDLVGELVILQSMIGQSALKTQDNEMYKSVNQLGKLVKEVQSVTMSLRMIPIKPTLQKLQRTIRDTALALGKKVDLVLTGEETEVDKTVLEKLTDPLVHVVRNAVDHGIEIPADRSASGKSEAGNVRIQCFHEGNNLVIEVIDDGKGINPEAVLASAKKKGVVSANATLTKEQIINLIFHPGFSTKQEVSEVSGRGVGMDVVKTNVEKLSGRVQVFSEIGQGSRFRVELPLTMAVIDGMIISTESSRYVFPLSQVHETLQIDTKQFHRITNLGEILVVRGQKIPVRRLKDVLGIKASDKPAEQMTAIIVNSQKGAVAVLVDDILTNQQVVIKNINSSMNRHGLFIGSSILGDGLPSLIVDLNKILEMTVLSREVLSA